MRVAFTASTLKLGGAERITGEVSRRLAARGFEVAWLLLREAGREGERLRALGLEVVEGLAPAKLDPRAPLKLAAEFRRRKVDAVYALDHQNALVASALAVKGAGVPHLFLAFHTTGLWGGGESLAAGVRAALPAVEKVIAIAETQKRYLVDSCRIDEEKIVVIRNGIDVAAFETTPERVARAAALRREWGGGPIIGVIAALRPEKGHRVILAALEKLPGVQLILVGEGEERAALEEEVTGRGLTDRVRLLGARDDIADLLPAFDVVALPSLPAVETLPLAVMEAMAAGRPVVATQVGSLAELVDDGRTGLLVPPDDAGALAAALGRLISDRPTADQFGRQAALRSREFDLARTVEETARLLEGNPV